jgi:hypothetical protein
MQGVVQLKTGEIQVFERGEFDSGARRKMMTLRQDLGVNLVIIGLDARFLGERGKYCHSAQDNKKVRTPQEPSCNIHEKTPELLKISGLDVYFFKKAAFVPP